ncbi:MAG: zinc ribbon domain-containing protein [Planctomycetota bacterium]|jgi:RNA polymerase subunit RPABC4/transcription elongation factor Spt4
MDNECSNNMPITETSAKTEEEKINPGHSKVRPVLRIIGPVMLAIGGLCILAALIDVARVIFTGDGFPQLFFLFFFGGPMLVVGFGLTSFAFMGAVARYQAGEVAPVAKDTINYMADGTQEGIKTAANALGQGLASGFAVGGMAAAGIAPEDSHPGVRCHKCNFVETPEAKFCSECGAAMEKSKACPNCKELNDPDAKFCDNCGNTF